MSVKELLNYNHEAEPWKDIRVSSLVVDDSFSVTSQAKGSLRIKTFVTSNAIHKFSNTDYEAANSNDISPYLFVIDGVGDIAVEESGQYLISAKVEVDLGVFSSNDSISLVFKDVLGVNDIISSDAYVTAAGVYTMNFNRLVTLSNLSDYELVFLNPALHTYQIIGGGNSYFSLLKI